MDSNDLEHATTALRERDGSGHGLLLVMLGEFVWRVGEEAVWLATLVRALAALDITENATRKAIQRMREAGLLSFERHGRQTRCALTGGARALFEDGARRVFTFEPRLPDWDGRWLVVAASVPESMRKLRHQTWSRLQRAGLGSPVPGLWITPHADTPIASVLSGAGNATSPLSFIGPVGPLGSEADIVAAAWDLGQLATLYSDFIARFGSRHPTAAEEVFQAYVGLIQAWRRFPFLDPRLPDRFLPEDWVGLEACTLFAELRMAWKSEALAYWNAMRI